MEPDILANPADTRPESGAIALNEGGASTSGGTSLSNGTSHHTNGHAAHLNGMRGGHLHHAPMPSWTHRLTGPVALVPSANVAETLAAIDSRSRGIYLRFGKRALDLVGTVIALVLTSPVLLLAAIAIKLESRGPVFYRSVRIGRGGKPFTFLKLRSMVQDADRHRHQLTHLNECDGPVFKISRDPRVTRVGRFLRTTSIDEIPQFLNVLRGDMSLVGPRPPIPEEVAQYEPWQLRRLDVLPGITCLWQISGRSRIGFTEWMRLDLEYIKHQSFASDVRILIRTIPAVLSREGAY